MHSMTDARRLLAAACKRTIRDARNCRHQRRPQSTAAAAGKRLELAAAGTGDILGHPPHSPSKALESLRHIPPPLAAAGGGPKAASAAASGAAGLPAGEAQRGGGRLVTHCCAIPGGAAGVCRPRSCHRCQIHAAGLLLLLLLLCSVIAAMSTLKHSACQLWCMQGERQTRLQLASHPCRLRLPGHMRQHAQARNQKPCHTPTHPSHLQSCPGSASGQGPTQPPPPQLPPPPLPRWRGATAGAPRPPGSCAAGGTTPAQRTGHNRTAQQGSAMHC